MARRILRDRENESIEVLKEDLTYYISKGRIAYLEMLNTIKPNSDFIIDGNLSIDNLITEIVKKIKTLN